MKKIIILLSVFLCVSFIGNLAFADANEKENLKTTTAVITSADFAKEFDEARLISLAAGACAGTYVPGGKASEYSYLGEYGWEINPYVVKNGDVESNFMIATSSKPVKNNDHLVVFAFRGSASKNDWKLNLTVDRVIFGGHTIKEFEKIARENLLGKELPRVHKGFNEYVMNAFKLKADVPGDNLSKNMVDLLKQNPNQHILLTGHSLGGAAATLFAERLVALGIPKEQVPVITFGAPAVGNKAFAEQFGDKINLLRVVTSFDPVPGSLQSIFGGFKQFGEVKEFDLSSTYTDFQHPISFYFDLALKNYFDTYDQGVEYGYLKPVPMKQLKGNEPLVAIAVAENKDNIDTRYSPDIKRFVVNEYISLFPRYVVLDANGGFSDKNGGFEMAMIEKAREAKADYIVMLEVSRRRIGQTSRIYVSLNQELFDVKERELLSLEQLGSRVTFEEGYMQNTITNMVECQKTLQEKLPFINKEKTNMWIKNDVLHK